MTLTPPDWLTRHGGDLKLGPDQKTWYVVFEQQPHYSLACLPAEGKVGCTVRQTENGRLLEHAATYDTPETALRGGLEALGKELGWTE